MKNIEDTLDYKAIGQRIKFARIRRGFTQEYIAEKIGISITHMSNIETSRTKVGLISLVKIANVLDTTAADLLTGNVDKAGQNHLEREFANLMHGCNDYEFHLVLDFAKAAKAIIQKNSMGKDLK